MPFIENNLPYSTNSNFDITDGSFTFTSTDKEKFPPGNYELQVTSTIGTSSVTVSYYLTILNTCETATLSDGVNPFLNGPFQYVVILDPQLPIAYDMDTIVTSSEPINCGPLHLTFYESQGGSINPTYFVDDQSDRNNAEFQIGPSNSNAGAGDHFMYFTAYFEDAINNVFVSDEFMVAIVDACDPHNDYPKPVITAIEDQTLAVDVGEPLNLAN